MNSICFFASYYTSDKIPYYLSVYLKELKKHFTKVVLLSSKEASSEEDKRFLLNEGIEFKYENNEGFDFGIWYKAFQFYDLSTYDQVALVNDSCVLFKSLNEFMSWCVLDKADAKGMTISEAISPHIQSYFIVLNKNATTLTANYFKKHKILSNISEVINTYEVGLSKYLIENGAKINAFIDNNGYKGEFSPYYFCVDYHLIKGIPLIKKKILFSSYRKDELMNLARMGFNIDPEYYLKLLKSKNNHLLIDLDKLSAENNSPLSSWEKIKYACVKIIFKRLRPLYNLIK